MNILLISWEFDASSNTVEWIEIIPMEEREHVAYLS